MKWCSEQEMVNDHLVSCWESRCLPNQAPPPAVGRLELKGLFGASQASHGASAGLYVLLNFAASCKRGGFTVRNYHCQEGSEEARAARRSPRMNE